MERSDAILKYMDTLRKFNNLVLSGKAVESIANSDNYKHIVYTYIHRQEIFKLGDRLGIAAREIYRTHDVDKMISYIYMPKPEVHEMHIALSEHHNRETKDSNALVEMMLDWESARFTKPDKPLNAYDTLRKFYKPMEPVMMPILMAYNLNRPTNYSEAVSKEYFNAIASQVSPNEIYIDILQNWR